MPDVSTLRRVFRYLEITHLGHRYRSAEVGHHPLVTVHGQPGRRVGPREVPGPAVKPVALLRHSHKLNYLTALKAEFTFTATGTVPDVSTLRRVSRYLEVTHLGHRFSRAEVSHHPLVIVHNKLGFIAAAGEVTSPAHELPAFGGHSL